MGSHETSQGEASQGQEASLFAGRRGAMSFDEASVASRFHVWHGESGRRFVTSVFSVDPTAPDAGLPDYDGSIVIAARRHGGSRAPIAVVQVERDMDLRSSRSLGLANGADEWHVHLLARGPVARTAAAADLRAAHPNATRG